MLQLIQNYTLSEIFTFVIILAISVKSLISFCDYFGNYIKKIFNKEHFKLNEKIELERRLQHGSEIMNTLTANQKATDETLAALMKKINMLIDSDKDAIKAYITKEHHYFCYQLGWIDDYNLACIERRYEHYKDQGGNSFIGGFMNELRALPSSYQLKNKNIHTRENSKEA